MMNLLTIEDISKSYSEKTLLDKISLGINDGDKIGIIGLNGAGKSTLLKIIGGVEEPDAGKRIVGSDVKVEYLPQNPVFYENATVLEQVFRGSSSVMKLLREYENTIEYLSLTPSDESAQKKIMQLNHQMDAAGAWQLESEAKTVLTRLGIKNFNARVEELSGGQRKRIALASALITPSDLLILDEPTNHLDNNTVDWLEQFLNKRKGALIMITHDRYFLDRVANRIIELDRGNLYSYIGNYSVYLEKKLEREELEQASERKRQSILRKELAWIRRGAKARTTKQKARIDRFEKLSEDGIEINNDKLEITAAASRLGKKVIEIENIDKSFNGIKLIEDFSYIVLRNDRVGIIGPNGSGKSTLMNIIAGKLSPDSGSLSYGETVKIAYFSQENVDMDDRLRAIDYIREEAEYVAAPDGTLISASKMLERFLFSGAMQYTPLSKLSGGEKRRLYLLRILMSAPNVLLLDEPTNDIDIQTLTILEDYIDDFSGAVIAVSHDRYFLDRTADKIFSFEGNGVIIQHTGNYSDYVEFKDSNPIIEKKSDIDENKKSNSVDKKKEIVDKKDKPIKFTFKEKKEFDEIDSNIENAENELADINKNIDECSSDYEKLQELLKKKEEMESRLEYLMERWMYLNEIAENMK